MAGSRSTRLGGRTDLPSGDLVVWSAADGRRGRRWRESTSRDGVVLRTILAETEPGGDLRRLEMSTAAGLLTLHPDAAGTTLHGNVVTPDGIRHLAFAWARDRAAILVEGSPAVTAIAVAWIGRGIDDGRSAEAEVLRIDDRLIPLPGSLRIERLGPSTWRLSGGAGADGDLVATLDADGLPSTERTVWPLER